MFISKEPNLMGSTTQRSGMVPASPSEFRSNLAVSFRDFERNTRIMTKTLLNPPGERDLDGDHNPRSYCLKQPATFILIG